MTTPISQPGQVLPADVRGCEVHGMRGQSGEKRVVRRGLRRASISRPVHVRVFPWSLDRDQRQPSRTMLMNASGYTWLLFPGT